MTVLNSPNIHILRHFAMAAAVAITLLAGAAGTAHAASNALPVDAAPLDIPGETGHSMRFDEAETDAALPAGLPPPEHAILRVLFASDSSTLNDNSITEINIFAASFKERGGRVRLRGYAGSPGSSSSNMRRLSLRRVLAVRDYLLTQGISADRITVQALGGVTDAGPLNRVDILKPGR